MFMAHNINQLPEDVVEKIAAGEVIERPASVLKELIENALDARATRISITIEEAGFGLIKIRDNGAGIAAEDLPLAIKRYATSKIRNAADLFSISSMGFRGEALASIAAVSRMKITSAVDQSGLGATLSCNGGTVSATAPASHTQGTSIEIRDLFFNVPARKKFMKSHRSERNALLRLVEQLAAAAPSTHFSLQLEGKKSIDTPVAKSLHVRISQIAGTEFGKHLIRSQYAQPGIDCTIYLTPPEMGSAKPRFQILYVNLRRVDSPAVIAAVREAHGAFTSGELKPAFFCFIDIEPRRIDVNVHPTKKNVKFENERLVYKVAYQAARNGLAQLMGHSGDTARTYATPPESSASIAKRPLAIHETPTEEAAYRTARLVSDDTGARQTGFAFPATPDSGKKQLDSPQDNRVQLAGNVQDEVAGLISCYQIHERYVLAPIKNGILLIDQRAAHERILYEQALENLTKGQSESQQLLFPIVLELTPAEKNVAASAQRYFVSFGYEIRDFGGTSVAISAIPSFMKDSAAADAVRTTINTLLDEGDMNRIAEPAHRFSAAFARGAAIRAGQKLETEEMNALLNNLFSTENPYIGPDGRPTVVRISLDELSRRFLR
ncbi:MAG: DNA mismatch repair endonuclease MutL [Chitinivibrionales bacterium]|nr:DNA mismatch repair endonuclease MutL [Chitinivibrionales bacterium]